MLDMDHCQVADREAHLAPARSQRLDTTQPHNDVCALDFQLGHHLRHPLACYLVSCLPACAPAASPLARSYQYSLPYFYSRL